MAILDEVKINTISLLRQKSKKNCYSPTFNVLVIISSIKFGGLSLWDYPVWQ